MDLARHLVGLDRRRVDVDVVARRRATDQLAELEAIARDQAVRVRIIDRQLQATKGTRR